MEDLYSALLDGFFEVSWRISQVHTTLTTPINDVLLVQMERSLTAKRFQGANTSICRGFRGFVREEEE